MKFIKLTGSWKQNCIPKLLDVFSNTSCSKRNKSDNFQKPLTISSFIFPTIILHFLFLLLMLSCVGCVVVYQVRFISTKSGRTDYVVAGESIELSCHYIMKDEAEDIKQLVWSKDGKNFLKWRKNKPGLEVLSYTFKGHIDPISTNSHITIHNVTIDMHGKYACSIKTDLGIHEMEQDLTVISQTSCKLNDWRVTSHPGQCRETFKLDCRNMFPKPVPSCGLWNSKLDKFIRSITVDISEEPNKQTYRIKYSDKFELPNQITTTPTNYYKQQKSSTNNNNVGFKSNSLNSDLLQYAGHLMFKCDIIVPETSWKLSIMHRMFDYNDGCYQNPLETIERMRQNYSYYAASKMQQAGYLMDKPLDDFEMLASQLKYEILPANYSNINSITTSTSISAKSLPQKVDLNCWQKPVVGSLARLSCATQSSHIKLMGTNLLECQPTGWVPLMESNVNNIKKYSNRRKNPRFSRQDGTSNTYSTVNLDLVNNNSNYNNENDKNLSENDSSNDLEESSNVVQQTTIYSKEQSKSTNIPHQTTTTTNEEVLVFEDSQSVSTLSALQQQQQGPNNLSPAQLAALLPTCVSTKRRHHHQSIINSNNKLPLLDEARILESSSSQQQAKQHLGTTATTTNQQQDKNRQRNLIFYLSPSGSETKFCFNGHHQTIAGVLLIFVLWWSMFSTRYINIQNLSPPIVVQQQSYER